MLCTDLETLAFNHAARRICLARSRWWRGWRLYRAREGIAIGRSAVSTVFWAVRALRRSCRVWCRRTVDEFRRLRAEEQARQAFRSSTPSSFSISVSVSCSRLKAPPSATLVLAAGSVARRAIHSSSHSPLTDRRLASSSTPTTVRNPAARNHAVELVAVRTIRRVTKLPLAMRLWAAIGRACPRQGVACVRACHIMPECLRSSPRLPSGACLGKVTFNLLSCCCSSDFTIVRAFPVVTCCSTLLRSPDSGSAKP